MNTTFISLMMPTDPIRERNISDKKARGNDNFL